MMFILFLFNCMIFSVENYYTPRFIMPYLDDLDYTFDYSWGDVAYRFLCEKMATNIVDGRVKVKQKKYLDGCLVGLMISMYCLYSIDPLTFTRFSLLILIICQCRHGSTRGTFVCYSEKFHEIFPCFSLGKWKISPMPALSKNCLMQLRTQISCFVFNFMQYFSKKI